MGTAATLNTRPYKASQLLRLICGPVTDNMITNVALFSPAGAGSTVTKNWTANAKAVAGFVTVARWRLPAKEELWSFS